MDRITIKQLEKRVEYLNILTNNSPTPWRVIDGKMVANIGTYVLNGAYGGYQVSRLATLGGGQSDVIHGFHSKRTCWWYLNAYIDGIAEGLNKEGGAL